MTARTSLTGTVISDSYKQVLHVSDTDGVTTTSTQFYDGNGTAIPLYTTTTGIGIRRLYELVTDDTVLTAADSGKVFAIATDAKTFTLPATAAGIEYTFVNTGADGNNIITISPNASDGIFGTITLAASVVQMAGTADTDVVNTKLSALKGDSMTLVGDGVDGWFIKASTGIWASA